MAKIGTFLKEVRVEMAKVVWPTRSQLVIYTLVVIGLSVFLMIYLGALDLAFQKVIGVILTK